MGSMAGETQEWFCCALLPAAYTPCDGDVYTANADMAAQQIPSLLKHLSTSLTWNMSADLIF